MIKNVIFDMGAVLMDWDPVKFINRYDISEEDKKFLFTTIYKSYQWQLMDFGYYNSTKDFLEEMKPQIPERLWKIACELTEDWDKPVVLQVPGTADIVRELKSKGTKIYLLSNAGPNQPFYWEKVDGHECFDGILVSAFEKMYKPSKEIYNRILEKFSLKAEECVFVDDMPLNCAGAFMVGIKPIVFRNADQLRVELKKLNLL